MKKYFITYGDELFEDAKKRVVKEAELIGEFDYIIAYNQTQVTDELKHSYVFSVKRGGGLWSWKPDVILQTLEKMSTDDILVYCDAGCQLQKCKEWEWYWRKLSTHDIIAQRIYQRTENWTRIEVLKEFENNGRFWPKMYQFQATIILKKTGFVMDLVRQWRDLMIEKPILAMDVTPEEKYIQHSSFIENRHDQAIYSALIYKYLSTPTLKDRVYVMWEHLEDIDIFSKQAIRATRCRTNLLPTPQIRFRSILKRIVKSMVYKPFIIAPQQIIYEFLNGLDLRKSSKS